MTEANTIQESEPSELDAKVYETRYRKIDGFVKPPSQREAAKSMSLFEVRRGLRGTWPKVPMVLAGFLIFGFVVQMSQGNFLGSSAHDFWIGTPALVTAAQNTPVSILDIISALLTPMDGFGFLIIIQITVTSAGLISGDLRDRAIDLYYSKLSVRSYYASKVIASLILTFIGLPLFTLIYFLIAVYKRLTIFSNFSAEMAAMGEVFWKMSLGIIVITCFLSVLILVFSAYTSNPVNAGVEFLVFMLVTRVFFEGILYNATNIDIFYVLSPASALDVIRRAIFAPDDISKQFLPLSIISYFAYIIASLVVVWIKLEKEKKR